MYFSKAERSAVIVLVILITVVIFLPYYFPKKKFILPVAKDEMAILSADSTEGKEYTPYFKRETDSYPRTELHPFNFDPNTLSESGWEKLGIRKKLIPTILKYRNAGGKFYKPGDIEKIYGIKPNEAKALTPFITITSGQEEKNSFVRNAQRKITRPLDINIAPVEDILALLWPDKRMTYRLINYREKTGGFYSVNEIKQVYGMTDTVFTVISPFIKIETLPAKKST
ncbi:MAG: DNA-binding protein [Chitinophagaceae bacterium]|nr:DNA-binding protein [Chitinophagaceae bacterium]